MPNQPARGRCPLCLQPLSPPFWRGAEGEGYRRCTGCRGAILENTRGGDPGTSYYRHAANLAIHDDPAVSASRSRHWERWLQRAAPGGGGRRLLDLGCGTGTFVEFATERGWHAQGCDPDAAAVAIGTQRGRAVRVGGIEVVEPGAELDLITAWDVLEHVYGVEPLLVSIRHALRPGGHLLLEVPDESFAGRRWVSALARVSVARLDGRRFLYHPDHVLYPTRSGMASLLHRTGFRIVRWGSASTDRELARAKARAFHGALLIGAFSAAARSFSVAARLGLGNKLIVVARR